MAILIQSISWTLIYSLAQGFLIYTLLRLALKLMPGASANVKYHLALSALSALFVWSAITWWQEFHSRTLANQELSGLQILDPLAIRQGFAAISGHGAYRTTLASIEIIAPWLSACYVLGLVLMLARLSVGMMQVVSLRKTGTSRAGNTMDDLLVSVKTKMGFNGGVQLFISAKAKVPMVIGFLKPIILVPAAVMAQLSVDQMETILLHELAHIKRYDYLINILQTVVETILFFNPFVWMVSTIIRRERELCCDDLVMGHTREPLYYATALAALASFAGSTPKMATAASGQRKYLYTRIKRIVEMKKDPFSYSRMFATLFIIATIIGSIAWVAPSFTQPKKSKQADTALQQSAPVQQARINDEQQETNQLIYRLMADHLVDESKGFSVLKTKDKLYINDQLQTADLAAKYLSGIKQDVISVIVHPMMERMMMHPDANMMQLLAPMEFSSPCVKKKPGC